MAKDFRRIGIYGGSFDPIHNAHVAVARHVIEELELDVMYVVVATLSPLKTSSEASFDHRFAMAKLAFVDTANAIVSDIEYTREPPSYTIDTIEYYQRKHPNSELWIVIGEDAASTIAQWHRWQDILESTRIVVVERRGYTPEQNTLLVKEIGQDNVDRLMNHWLQFDQNVSSTEIRAQLSSRQKLSTVPKKVAQYITENSLYK